MEYIAVDIGATNIRVANGDEKGIISKTVRKTDRERGAAGIASQIIEMIRDTNTVPNSIGIGTIGPVDLKTGKITDTPNLPYKEIPIVKPLTKEFDVKITMLNDCTAAVLGEHVFGAGKGIDDLFYVTLSTGLGGGAMVDGHLIKGKDGNAPEIGHLIIDSDSELVCGCGCRGHWEAYCSGNNIPQFARLIAKTHNMEDKLSRLADKNRELTTESIFESAKNNDSLALKIVNNIGRINTIGFADIVNAFDPELITLGGSIALKNPDLIINPIIENIELHLINRKPKIMITPLREDIVLYGALALAMKNKST